MQLKLEKIRIGTRGSQLALAQAHEVRQRLMKAHGMAEEAFDIRVISTAGDRIQDRPLSEVGGKGLFSKEIERALADGDIDLAVHSTKDMASVLPEGLVIGAYLPREDVRDAFLSPKARSIADLPHGAVIGSSSLRRQALIKAMRPDIDVVMFRGNLQTRMMKLDAGEVDGTLLAQAGLRRLGLTDRVSSLMETDNFLPAPGQGAICIEHREDDQTVRDLIAPIDHEETAIALCCERAYLKALDGSCRTPIAGYARLVDGELHFDALILSSDGTVKYGDTGTCPATREDAAALGERVGLSLRHRAGDKFFHHWT